MTDDEKGELVHQTGHHADLSELSGKDLILAVAKMNVGQKIVLALKGNAAVRRILMRDPNVEVQLAIVNSPKTLEGDIEFLAGLPVSAEVVLTTIFSDSRWSKSYRIKHALAKNPKTPASIATKCMRSLTAHDLRKLSVDPNARKSVSQAAQRMLSSHK